METVKVSSKGQIVIPKSLRTSQRINTGDSFVVTAEGKELRFKPTSAPDSTTLQMVAGILHAPGKKKVSAKQVTKAISARLRKQDAASKSK